MKTRLLIPILALGAFAGMAVAQDAQVDTTSDRTDSSTAITRQLVDLLGDESWVSRDQATIDLARLTDEIPLTLLETYIQDPTLTLEQRTRLYQACILRFHLHPKAGLGVAFGKIQVGAIELQPIQNDERFPASKMLNPGDLLAMIDGQIVTSSYSVRAQILAREPEELLPVTILRAGKALELDLPLGSFNQLTGAVRLDPTLAQRAILHRWDRRGIAAPSPDVIGSGIDLDQWINAAFPDGTTPDPHVPNRRMTTAIIAGSNQRAMIGYPRTLAIRKPFRSPEQINQRALAVQQKYDGYERQLIDAQLNVLTIQRDVAQNEIDLLVNGVEGPEAERNRTRVEQLKEKVELIKQQMADRRLKDAKLPKQQNNKDGK